MKADPLAALGDRALYWLADATDPGKPPRRRSPRLCDWLFAEACREQARRRGEAVDPAEDFLPFDLEPEEQLAAAEVSAMLLGAAKMLPQRVTLDAEDVHALAEVVGIYSLLVDAFTSVLNATEATVH